MWTVPGHNLVYCEGPKSNNLPRLDFAKLHSLVETLKSVGAQRVAPVLSPKMAGWLASVCTRVCIHSTLRARKLFTAHKMFIFFEEKIYYSSECRECRTRLNLCFFSAGQYDVEDGPSCLLILPPFLDLSIRRLLRPLLDCSLEFPLSTLRESSRKVAP